MKRMLKAMNDGELEILDMKGAEIIDMVKASDEKDIYDITIRIKGKDYLWTLIFHT